jgi:hypothetical protein
MDDAIVAQVYRYSEVMKTEACEKDAREKATAKIVVESILRRRAGR